MQQGADETLQQHSLVVTLSIHLVSEKQTEVRQNQRSASSVTPSELLQFVPCTRCCPKKLEITNNNERVDVPELT